MTFAHSRKRCPDPGFNLVDCSMYRFKIQSEITRYLSDMEVFRYRAIPLPFIGGDFSFF